MGLFTAGQVVVLPFPYSDLSGHKHRPVLLLAAVEYDDWIICQITSNPYADPYAVRLAQSDFLSGGLPHTSYARPTKLFTANTSLIAGQSGILRGQVFDEVREAVIALMRKS